jgi:hypothetical protein
MCIALVWSVHSNADARAACLQSGIPFTQVAGTLRMASRTYFVVDARWRAITTDCGGKTAMQCYAANPGIRALRDSVGASVRVEFCATYPVAYTVGGVRYQI